MSGPPEVSPARRCAFSVVRRVFEQGAYADRALQAESSGLDARERALATALAYGTVQRRATLDYVASAFLSRPIEKLDAPVLGALRLGLFQLLFLDGIADHAAVNESVELTKRSSQGGATLVNAVLRRAAREGRSLIDGLDDGTVAGAALAHSVPEWLAQKWFDELGGEAARGLLRRVNDPAESALRANELIATREQVLERLSVTARPADDLPEAIVILAPFDAHASALFHEGLITPQSRGSMAVARILAPCRSDRILDLCAAPGGKTTHLAALIADTGEITAVERHPGRASALRRTCERLRAGCVRVETGDATQSRGEPAYDRVLVDPPCSGLGTLQSRPDIRWRASPDSISELARLQARILAVAGNATAPGGSLVYSVCTISEQEGAGVVDGFLRSHPQFQADDLQREHPAWRHPDRPDYLQLLPYRDGTDGFFIARLRRK